MTPEMFARDAWITRTIRGTRELMRLGVRRSVAAEYRRLLIAGVNPASAGILARSPARLRREISPVFVYRSTHIHRAPRFVDRAVICNNSAVDISRPPAVRGAGNTTAGGLASLEGAD